MRDVAGGEGPNRAGFKGLCMQQKEFGIHPGDNGEYRSFSPGLA